MAENKENYSYVAEVLKEYSGMKGSLITILQKVQDKYNYVPREAMVMISEETGIKLSKIIGVVTFYTQFRTEPIGDNLIMLCQGTACHVNGSHLIEEAVEDSLKIKDGQTTEDGKFTLMNVACLGCCSLSPVMMINDETFGNLTPDSTKKLLKSRK